MFLSASYYQPPTSGTKIDPPLLPNSSVTIGYGAGGDVPYIYSLRENQDIDIGHLKLFLSTEYVDLSHVPQHSPFENFESVRQPSPSADVPRFGASANNTGQILDAILIPVFQRRSNSPFSPTDYPFKVFYWWCIINCPWSFHLCLESLFSLFFPLCMFLLQFFVNRRIIIYHANFLILTKGWPPVPTDSFNDPCDPSLLALFLKKRQGRAMSPIQCRNIRHYLSSSQPSFLLQICCHLASSFILCLSSWHGFIIIIIIIIYYSGTFIISLAHNLSLATPI